MNGGPDRYWLFEWLEQQRFADAEDVFQALDSRQVVESLGRLAFEWQVCQPADATECNLVAGSGLGAFNGITCPKFSCRVDHIESLFRHAWHYFDHIYLPDAAGDLLRLTGCDLNRQEIRELGEHIAVAHYLLTMGAEFLLKFYSAGSLEKSATDVTSDEIWDELQREISGTQSSFDISRASHGRIEVTFRDDKTSFYPTFTFPAKRAPKKILEDVLRDVTTRRVLQRHRAALEQDLTIAKTLRGSLGTTLWSHERVLDRHNREGDENAIFFQMEFPSLSNVPIEDLVSLRSNEKDAFLACRTALRKAVRQLQQTRPTERKTLAGEVLRDVVIPDISNLERRLSAARAVFAKKAAISVGIAAVSTWCGVHFGLNPALSAGGGALVAAGAGLKEAASKMAEERRDLEIADMSFIWKALRCRTR